MAARFEQLLQSEAELVYPSGVSTDLEKKLPSFAGSADAIIDRVFIVRCRTCGDTHGADSLE